MVFEMVSAVKARKWQTRYTLFYTMTSSRHSDDLFARELCITDELLRPGVYVAIAGIIEHLAIN